MADVTQNPASSKPAKNPHRPDKASSVEIRDPDAYQETFLGIWSWLEANAKPVGALLFLGLAALTVVVGMKWSDSRKEKKAQEAYFLVESKFNKLKEGYDKAKFKALMPQTAPKDDKSNDKPATGDLEKDYGSLLSDFEKVARENAGTAAAAQAAILAGETYLAYGQADKAVAITDFVSKKTDDKMLLGALVRVELGSALAAKGDCKEAVKVWGQLLDNKSASYLHGDVSLRSGLCFEQMGENQKAMEMYSRVTAEAKQESGAAQTAKGLLRALEMKTKSNQPTTASTGKG